MPISRRTLANPSSGEAPQTAQTSSGVTVAPSFRKRAMDDSRRSFLRMVSHELRTPLNSIIGFAEIISRELYGPISEPKYQEHAEFIRVSGLKMLQLVNEIIEIARLESGAADLDLRAEPIAPIIAECVRSLEPLAAERQVKLETHQIDLTLQAKIDARGLSTALEHLLRNAIAYSPDGASVRVVTRLANNAVVIEVQDDGEGVPPEALAKLMRPFGQDDSSLVRTSEGPGLGLPLARLICDAMGGKLRLTSGAARGLTATMRLPLAD